MRSPCAAEFECPDMAQPLDLTPAPDVSPVADMTAPPDAATPLDLAVPLDFAIPTDLTIPLDLTVPPDMTVLPPVYTVTGFPSGVGRLVSTGGPWSLEGTIGIPGPRGRTSQGGFSVEPLLPQP